MMVVQTSAVSVSMRPIHNSGSKIEGELNRHEETIEVHLRISVSCRLCSFPSIFIDSGEGINK